MMLSMLLVLPNPILVKLQGTPDRPSLLHFLLPPRDFGHYPLSPDCRYRSDPESDNSKRDSYGEVILQTSLETGDIGLDTK